ncbi:DNA-directed RNA polymerase II subunit RPB1 [Bienertia sinuspersici]
MVPDQRIITVLVTPCPFPRPEEEVVADLILSKGMAIQRRPQAESANSQVAEYLRAICCHLMVKVDNEVTGKHSSIPLMH